MINKALFVFDHKYPCDCDGQYYYSSGFDKEFFSRYLEIFDSLDIIGRRVEKDCNILFDNEKISLSIKFFTIRSYKELSSQKLRKKWIEIIRQYNYLVIRMPSVLGSFAIIQAKKFSIPYIVEVVSSAYDALSCGNSLFRKIMAHPMEIFYRFLLKNNPYTIYVTESFLESKYPCNGKHIACSNVTLPEVQDSKLSDRLNKIQCKNQKILLGTTATLDVGFKGQQYVIEAIPYIINKGYDVYYQMVGDGNGETLLNLAKNLGISDRVHIIGRLPHEAIFDWLDTLDIYVHPSCQEGLSRAIIEAMSCACPIVASNSGGIHELIDERYIVPIKNPIALADAIIFLMNSNMSKQAIINHQNSKKYLMSTLYKRRKEFFAKWMEENNEE